MPSGARRSRAGRSRPRSDPRSLGRAQGGGARRHGSRGFLGEEREESGEPKKTSKQRSEPRPRWPSALSTLASLGGRFQSRLRSWAPLSCKARSGARALLRTLMRLQIWRGRGTPELPSRRGAPGAGRPGLAFVRSLEFPAALGTRRAPHPQPGRSQRAAPPRETPVARRPARRQRLLVLLPGIDASRRSICAQRSTAGALA